MSPRHLVIPSLFLLALALRLIGLRWGLPAAQRWYSYHPDELQIAAAVARLDFFNGDFNPNFFNYPSLFIYLTYVTHGLMNGLGLTQAASQPAMWSLLRDIILAGRLVSALLGAATVPLVYALDRAWSGHRASGHRVSGHRAGLFAALLMALLPGHVQHSHFATVDVPATFLVALSLWLATRALQPREDGEDEGGRDDENEAEKQWRLKQLLLSAGAAGLAAATKYNAGLVLVAPLAGLYLLRNRDSGKIAGMMLGAATLGFLIGCPYSILSFREFWGDGKNLGFAYELFVHPRQGSGQIFHSTGNGWWYHLSFNLPFVMTAPVLGVALVGAVAAVRGTQRESAEREGAERKVVLPATLFALVYFIVLGFSQVRFMRYILPLLPAFCAFAAIGCLFLARRLAPPHRLPLAELVIGGTLTTFALLGSINVLSPLTQTDPRDQAIAWLDAQMDATPIEVGLAEQPWFYTPPLTPRNAPPGSSSAAIQQALSGNNRYVLQVIGFDARQLETQKPQWFVMSEFEWRDKERLNDAAFARFMSRLAQLYELKATFKNRVPLALPGRSFVPHDYLYANPAVRVYGLKKN